MTSYDSRRYAMVNRWDSSHLRRIDRLVPIRPGDRVLEVGCGQGHLTKALHARGVDIIGIDANPQAEVVADTDRVRFMHAESLDFEVETAGRLHAVHVDLRLPTADAGDASL